MTPENQAALGFVHRYPISPRLEVGAIMQPRRFQIQAKVKLL